MLFGSPNDASAPHLFLRDQLDAFPDAQQARTEDRAGQAPPLQGFARVALD